MTFAQNASQHGDFLIRFGHHHLKLSFSRLQFNYPAMHWSTPELDSGRWNSPITGTAIMMSNVKMLIKLYGAFTWGC